MALVRAVALKDFRTESTGGALSTAQNGSAYSTVAPVSGQVLHGCLHLTAISTARTFAASIQSASSSGFASITSEIQWAMTTELASTWKTLSSPSTDRMWRRFAVTISTAAGSTGGSWNGLAWMAFSTL